MFKCLVFYLKIFSCTCNMYMFNVHCTWALLYSTLYNVHICTYDVNLTAVYTLYTVKLLYSHIICFPVSSGKGQLPPIWIWKRHAIEAEGPYIIVMEFFLVHCRTKVHCRGASPALASSLSIIVYLYIYNNK